MPPGLPNTPPASPPPIQPVQNGEIDEGDADNFLEPGEKTIVVVHRHPIGLIFIFLEALIGVIALGALLIFVTPSALKNSSPETNRLVLGGAVFAVAILFLFLFVASYVYRQSRLIIADKSLIQVLQKSLFYRDVSRLSFSNVQDVTGEQRGILPTIFGYGTLEIQTAGEMDNFLFPTCPNPNKYAHIILEARQRYAAALESKSETDV